MRARDWYFQGWERRERDGKTELVYTGEYYTLPGGDVSAKARCVGLAAALAAVYAVVALCPSAGGMWHIAAIPQLLELIPLVYLIIGAVCLLVTAQPMTYRGWYTSWRRMRCASAWSFGFTAVMTLVQLVYILALGEGTLGRELLYLAGVVVCAALSLALVLYFRKNPCSASAARSEKES